jgi:putative drug exporter of the RND superfamily
MTFTKLSDLIVNRPRLLVGLCLGLIVLGLALALRFSNSLLGVGYQAPGSESDKATDFIEDTTGYSETDTLVISSDRYTYDDPQFQQALNRGVAAIKEEDSDVLVAPPGQNGGGQVSPDRKAATVTVALKGDVADRQDFAKEVQDPIDDAVGGDFEAGLTGNSPVLADLLHTEEVDSIKAEAVGFPIALFLLLLAFGTVVAAGLPLMMAYGGLIGSIGVVGLLMFGIDFNAFAETFMVMFGLALGIDYSLLFVRRFREERRRGGSDKEVVERTLKTAGRTIIFSGSIFSACLFPVVLTGLPFFYDTSLAVIVVVAVELLFLLTLLPVVLVKLGDRLEKWRLPGPLGTGRLSEESPGWSRWARMVMARPAVPLLLGTAILLVAAIPVLNLKTGIDLNVRAMEGDESVKPIDDLREHFPSAAVSPVEVLIKAPPAQIDDASGAARQTMESQKLVDISAVRISDDAIVLAGTPTAAIDSDATFDQIGDLRTALDSSVPGGAEAQVTGVTAETVDYTEETEDVQPWVIAFALTISFLLLLMVFRSPVLATKAIVMNLLSIGAALGLTVLLFQEGHAESILGFESPGYLQSWTPLTLFIMLFGLSMDYEVFMVSRIREEYDKRGDTAEAVAHGLSRTGAVVTYAAFIMIAIFGSFMLSSIPEMKQLGFALSASVLIDATIVRAMLVPAFMRIAGKWNWWIPQRLDRVLPEVRH